jgi:hypothetical protein
MATDKIGNISMFSNFNENEFRHQPIPHFKILLNINFHWNRRPLTIWRFCWQPFWKWWPRRNDPECKFHHYQTAVGWCIVILCFFFTIIIIILPHIFVRSISRRCLDQTLWNLVGISYAMWRCAVKGWFFGFHGNCGKVCPINSDFFLDYLVPLDVDVVPIKFHQFLFGE